MSPLAQIHDGLANTSILFIAALGIWALVFRIRSQPLDGAWYGAAIVGELLIVVQAVIGAILYLQGLGGTLPRPFLHILYGIVAVLTLPAAYAYFGNLEDEQVKALALALACFFLWGILLRASAVAEFVAVGV